MKDIYQKNNLLVVKKIIEVGLKSFNPEVIINNLDLGKFQLNVFNNIYLIGFGKGSSALAKILEIKIPKINDGLIVDVKNFGTQKIKVVDGTHPLPSAKNILATKKIIKICQKAGKDDLVIAIICGGGSALLASPVNSLEMTKEIYQKLILSGASIGEMNVVRSHLDDVKGGGLAKIISPAKTISLLVSDVPNNDLSTIASGPTVFNKTTVLEAKDILKKYKIYDNNINYIESPKDKKIFKDVKNIIIADNSKALENIQREAKKTDLNTYIYKTNLNLDGENIVKELISKNKRNFLLLAGGEAKIKVKNNHGKGGRNTHLCALALKHLKPGMVFASIASDGHDNSNAAGAIVDFETIIKCRKMKLDINKYIENFDTYNLFKKTGNLLSTGNLPINVSDLYFVLRK